MRSQALLFCLSVALCAGCSADSSDPEGDTQAAQAEPSVVADSAMTDDASELSPEVDAGAEADGTVVPDDGATVDDAVTPDETPDDAGTPDEAFAADGAASEVPDTGPTDVALSDPGESGTFAFDVTTHTATLEADGGSEDVLTVIYMPEGDGPFPVVVFTHGFQLAPADYVSYGEHLASWGYIALLPQFPGGLFGGPTHVDLGNYLAALLDWVEADTMVLSGKADAARIALAGHSMGGKISLLLASEDARPMAVFGVDPVDAAGGPIPMPEVDYPSVTPERMGSITVPLGLLGETTNGASEGIFGQACAPAEDNFQAYFDHAESPAIAIDVLGASHMSFLDDPECGLACFACPSGTDDPATSRMLAQRYMVALFNVFVQGEAGYMDYLTGDAMAADVAAGLVSSEAKNAF
jgi:predicted dienelactone hydrolase